MPQHRLEDPGRYSKMEVEFDQPDSIGDDDSNSGYFSSYANIGGPEKQLEK